jgi:hypothetical protein
VTAPIAFNPVHLGGQLGGSYFEQPPISQIYWSTMKTRKTAQENCKEAPQAILIRRRTVDQFKARKSDQRKTQNPGRQGQVHFIILVQNLRSIGDPLNQFVHGVHPLFDNFWNGVFFLEMNLWFSTTVAIVVQTMRGCWIPPVPLFSV